jgi:hypothetical protein
MHITDRAEASHFLSNLPVWKWLPDRALTAREIAAALPRTQDKIEAWILDRHYQIDEAFGYVVLKTPEMYHLLRAGTLERGWHRSDAIPENNITTTVAVKRASPVEQTEGVTGMSSRRIAFYSSATGDTETESYELGEGTDMPKYVAPNEGGGFKTIDNVDRLHEVRGKLAVEGERRNQRVSEYLNDDDRNLPRYLHRATRDAKVADSKADLINLRYDDEVDTKHSLIQATERYYANIGELTDVTHVYDIPDEREVVQQRYEHGLNVIPDEGMLVVKTAGERGYVERLQLNTTGEHGFVLHDLRDSHIFYTSSA